jgi:hypothetical protein
VVFFITKNSIKLQKMILERKINWAIRLHFVKIQLNYKKMVLEGKINWAIGSFRPLTQAIY